MQATKNPVETGGVWSIGCAGTYDTPIPSPGAGDFFDDRGKGVILFMGGMMRGERGDVKTSGRSQAAIRMSAIRATKMKQASARRGSGRF